MTPQTHIRYRAQRLIRMGEWLERNKDILITCFDAIDDAHTQMIDCEANYEDCLEYTSMKMMSPIKASQELMVELRHLLMCRDVKRGTDLTMINRFGCEEHRETIVAKAPVPQNIPPVSPDPSLN